jgi:NAD+ diphosphatase
VDGVNTFSGAGLDRAGTRRTDEAWVRAKLRDPASRAIGVAADGVLVEEDRLARIAVPHDGVPPLLLGLDDRDAALFALDMDSADPPSGTRVAGLREAASVLSQAEGGLVAHATGLVNWHRRHPHCSVCGARTEVAEAGYVRRCPSCGAMHHPRTDPVVIMLVVDGDRALLGRQARWPPGRYSALAGFVEPGETLEEAVAREVREEAGVEVHSVRYQSSQPWPFPSSLMLGFVADYAGGEAAPRDKELEDVRWFSRAELEEIRAGRVEGMHLPPPIAIARTLVDGWLG